MLWCRFRFCCFFIKLEIQIQKYTTKISRQNLAYFLLQLYRIYFITFAYLASYILLIFGFYLANTQESILPIFKIAKLLVL